MPRAARPARPVGTGRASRTSRTGAARSTAPGRPRSTSAADYQRVPRPVAAMAKAFPDGYRIPMDRHERGQLIYATAGVMTVSTPDGSWVVPPQRAVWVPPGIEHESRMNGDVAMRTLYISRAASRALPARCCVVGVSPLLRELILAAVAMPLLYAEHGRDGRIMRLVLDELAASPALPLPLQLPQPRDRRLARICAAVLRDPAAAKEPAEWARGAGISLRHMARLFRQETQLSFGMWCQQAKLLQALHRLAAGEAVTNVALELGYASPSAFSAMFRKMLGVQPSRYFGDAARHPGGTGI